MQAKDLKRVQEQRNNFFLSIIVISFTNNCHFLQSTNILKAAYFTEHSDSRLNSCLGRFGFISAPLSLFDFSSGCVHFGLVLCLCCSSR